VTRRVGDVMETTVKVEWQGKLRFKGTNAYGQSKIIDATDVKGRPAGVTPMQLLLMALGGCTGIDIVIILRKQRQNLKALTVNVAGHQRSDPPRYYERMHVEYVLKGSNLDEKKAREAIQLSEEKYCSVRAMLMDKARVTSSHRIEK